MSLTTPWIETVKSYFVSPTTPEDDSFKTRIAQCGLVKVACAVAGIYCIIKSIRSNALNFATAYTLYEGATIAKNLQMLYVKAATEKDGRAEGLFSKLTAHAPISRLATPYFINKETLKEIIFPSS